MSNFWLKVLRAFGGLLIFVSFAITSHALEQTQPGAPDPSTLAAVRRDFLDSLFQGSYDYTPGKRSYLFQGLKRSERRTVLNLTGSGSVRHLWSTWSVPGSNSVPAKTALLRIYVDNSSTPSIVGTVD